jgi:hypothetical protein
LLGLLAAVEADGRYRALELQCSVARGAGDELSDLDAGLWAADDAWDGAVAAVPALLRGLAPTVDLLERTEAATMYFFAQYEDGTQIDLLVLRASTAKGRVPTAVVLFDPDGLLAEPWTPASLEASAAEVREWSFLAWLALSNLDKYLRRGSLWEARAQLEYARSNLLRLHATRLAVPYPGFGLTSLLDDERASLPHGLDATVATLDAGDLRRAGVALAHLLEGYEPPPLSRLVRARLA